MAGISNERIQCAAARQIPKFDGAVVTSRSERSSVRREGDRCESKAAWRTTHDLELAPRCGNPESHRGIVTARSECLAIRRKLDGRHGTRMARQRPERVPARDIPQFDRVILAR